VAAAVVAGAVVMTFVVVVVVAPALPAGALEREPSSQPAIKAAATIRPTAAALKTRRPARITHVLHQAGIEPTTRVRDMSHMSQTIGRREVYH